MKKFKLSFNLVLLLIWAAIFIAIAAMAPTFLKPDYIINTMLRNIVEIGMVALPMTLIIITGGMDLSVGSMMILCAVFGGSAAAAWGSGAGVAVTVLVGLACGLINGLIIAKARISEMVTTLATMYLFMGLSRGYTEAGSVYAYDFATWMGNTEVLGLPIQIWIYAVLAVLFILLLHHTGFGRKLFAIGLNSSAAKYSGVNVERIKITLYVLCGLICALASFIYLGRFSSVKYDSGTNFNLKVITVVVLGGTSIVGGSGDMKGTLAATLIIATLNSGLTVLNIPIATQTVVQGTVLLIALVAFAIMNQAKSRRRGAPKSAEPKSVS